ncbi:hypothetical protein [Micromonospora sp. DT231]|uniref:hypothetical protein n=1 Tax=Micromonospora sp. DT231 TaxID=3416526 RepID=UPI003CF6A287
MSPAAPAAEPTTDPDEPDARDQRRDARVINQFYGQVHATSATFGVSGGAVGGGHASVGRLPAVDVDHALRYFAPPDGYVRAAVLLREQGLVFLTGDEGTGRRASAFALLRDRIGTDGRINGLSPAVSLAQLVESEFVSGRGYVVLDWLGEKRDGVVQAFDAGRLADRLKRAGAHLVVTTDQRATARRDLGSFTVQWSPPDPSSIFQVYLERAGTLAEAEIDLVSARIAELRLPGEVARLLDRLPQGVGAALAEVEHTEQIRVSKWFATTSSWDDLLWVGALAFAHALPERTFEEKHARLREIEHAEDLRRSTLVEAGTTAEPLQGRRTLYRDGGLVARRYGDDPVGNVGWEERRVVFVADGMREHVLRELYECDYRLWRPLRIWINELAGSGSVEVRLQLALAVTLLARDRNAAPEVWDMLGQWSRGRAAERFTAVSALSFMAGEDALAPAALRLVLDWTDGAGQSPAVTAAMALGGPLGMRYPTEAERWLWHLSTRGRPIRLLAARSLGLLFCTAADELDSATLLLKRLVLRLRRTLEQAPDPRWVSYAVETVLEVLSAEHLEHSEPVVARLLRLCPSAVKPVGVLWAEVLRSLPHRSTAMDTLSATLESLAKHNDTENAVGALGDVLCRELTSAECVLLRRELSWALSSPVDPSISRPVIAALLAALAGKGARPALG